MQNYIILIDLYALTMIQIMILIVWNYSNCYMSFNAYNEINQINMHTNMQNDISTDQDL